MPKVKLPRLKLSLKTRYLILVGLFFATFTIILAFGLISFVGLGRGDVVVLVVNFTEAPLTVVSPQETRILSAFEIWAIELDLISTTHIETSYGSINVSPGRTPVFYSWILGTPSVASHCLAQTRLSLDRQFLGSEFEILGRTEQTTQIYRFDLPLNRLWWPTKSISAALPTETTNPNADYTFVFPVGCDNTDNENLLTQAKFWLNYDFAQVAEEYAKLQDLISDDPAYNDPGPT